MLSALAKYIFRAAVNEPSEETVQCETKEVNDWLLVNMKKQKVEDIENLEPESDEEEDDILSSLPALLTPISIQESCCDKSTFETLYPCDVNQNCMDTSVAIQSALPLECIEDFQILPESLYLNHSFYYPSDFSIVVSQCFRGVNCRAMLNIDQSMLIVHDTNNINAQAEKRKIKEKSQDSSESPLKRVNDKRVANPAALPKNSMNRRTPGFRPEIKILEHIDNFRPMQQALEYKIKKQLSRAQFNRQNKNYIYEGGPKTNRRKDLWRNHSGVNNNRKC